MSSSESFVDYLDDMLHAIEKAEQFVSGLSFDEFKNDEKTIFAVIRALEILGEASSKIPNSIRQEHSDLPWSEMKGMRNKLIHDYMGVNIEVVWKTTKEDLPELQGAVKHLRNNYSS